MQIYDLVYIATNYLYRAQLYLLLNSCTFRPHLVILRRSLFDTDVLTRHKFILLYQISVFEFFRLNMALIPLLTELRVEMDRRNLF
jgi:hypothetical protein